MPDTTTDTGRSLPDLLGALRTLAPSLAARAVEADRRRRPVDECMAAIAATGAYRFFVPKRYGGFEHPLSAFVDVGLILGAGCTSTAWVTTFCMEHNWMLAHFPQQAQDEIFGRQPYVVAPAAISPNGRARVHDGGYLLTGRWQWGTGAMHADWVMLAGIVEGAAAATDPDANTAIGAARAAAATGEAVAGRTAGGRAAGSEMRMFILPIAEVEIIDTWQMDGMAGTGSNDMQVQQVFVPAHRSQSLAQMSAGRSDGSALHGTAMYRMPMMPILYLAAGVPAVGAAQAALARFVARAPARVKFGGSTLQSESPETHVRIGQAQARLEVAEMICRQVAAETMAWGEREDPCPVPERVRHRLLMTHAVRTARDVVRDLFEASGANAHHLDEPLQRIHRDVHTIAAHAVFDGEVIAEQAGRLALGMPPTIRL